MIEKNATVFVREFDPLSITVKFFDLQIFSSGKTFADKLLRVVPWVVRVLGVVPEYRYRYYGISL